MLTLCVAALALAVEASPADSRFTLQGKVLDSTRAAVAGAKVTATADGSSARVSSRTDAQGDFRLALPPGPYTIRIEAAGFLDEVQPVRASEDGAESREFVPIVAGGG